MKDTSIVETAFPSRRGSLRRRPAWLWALAAYPLLILLLPAPAAAQTVEVPTSPAAQSAAAAQSPPREQPATGTQPATGAQPLTGAQPATGAQSPPGTQPAPAAQGSPVAWDQLSAQQLVERLGAAEYQERERARNELNRRGPAALAEIKAGREHADPEIRRRCVILTRLIEERDLQARIDRFLLLPIEATSEQVAQLATELQLPGWSRFQELTGHDQHSRRYFVEMLRAEWEFVQAGVAIGQQLTAAGAAGDTAAANAASEELSLLIENRLSDLQQLLQRGTDYPLSNAVGLCFVSLLDQRIDDNTAARLQIIMRHPNFGEELLGEPGAPLRSLVGHWIGDLRSGLGGNVVALRLSLEYQLAEAGAARARRVLFSDAAALQAKALLKPARPDGTAPTTPASGSTPPDKRIPYGGGGYGGAGGYGGREDRPASEKVPDPKPPATEAPQPEQPQPEQPQPEQPLPEQPQPAPPPRQVPPVPPPVAQLALQVMLQFGEKADVPLLETLLDDSRVIAGVGLGVAEPVHPGSLLRETRVSDLALYVALVLEERDPRQFGFTSVPPGDPRLYFGSHTGFVTQEQRDAAMAQWRNRYAATGSDESSPAER